MDVDPVVQEMRRHGDKIAEECGGDLHRMAERFRREQAKHTHRIVPRHTRSVPQRDSPPKPGS